LSWAFAKLSTTGTIALIGVAGAMYLFALAMEKLNNLGGNFYGIMVTMAAGIYGLTVALSSLGASAAQSAIGLALLFAFAGAVWAIGAALEATMPAWEKLLNIVLPVAIEYFTLLFDGIVKIVDILGNVLLGIFESVGNTIITIITTLTDAILTLQNVFATTFIAALTLVRDVIDGIGTSVLKVVTVVNNGIVSMATIISNTILGVLDRMIGIVNAITGGVVSIINAIKDFQNVDYAAVSKTAWAYTELAGALTAVGLASIAHGVGEFLGSIGGFLAKGIDATGDAIFGESDLADVNNYYNMTFSIKDAEMIGNAVSLAIMGQELNVNIKNTEDFNFGKTRG